MPRWYSAVTRDEFLNALRRGGSNDTLATIFVLGWLSKRTNRRGEAALLRCVARLADRYDRECLTAEQ